MPAIGLTAVYGLRTDANLSGADYSQIGAVGYYAQLVAQPRKLLHICDALPLLN